jgi:hypothetical protein
LYSCFVIVKKINNDKYVANINQHLKKHVDSIQE